MRLISVRAAGPRTNNPYGCVSFPLGFGGAIHLNASGRENVVFIAQFAVYARAVVRSCAISRNSAAISTDANIFVRHGGTPHSLSLAIDFDVYLGMKYSLSETPFQARCREAFRLGPGMLE